MTYKEMKDKIYKLQLEDLSHGIKVNELDNPKRFEAAGLGIIDLSQIKYCGPIGLFEIYSGSWNSPNKKTVQTIVPSIDVDVYETYFKLVKDIEYQIINQNK